jgi:Zn-dependent protease
MAEYILAASVIILIFSVIVHEVMHGYVALMFGDHTAERAGRLTLNPIPHIDPIGTILLPGATLLLGYLFPGTGGFLIGWAKPVPVNPLNFSDMRKGEIYVSLAGVLSNFALALVFAVLYHVTNALMPNLLLRTIFEFGVQINLVLAVFNLLPIPPLDGSKVLIALLPYQAARRFEQVSMQYGFFIIILLLYLNIIGSIMNLIIPPLMMLLGISAF